MKKLFYVGLFFIFVSVVNADTTKVLFAGNSYTYANDLPLLLKNLSSSMGRIVYTDMSAPGGYTFEQHLTNAETISKISRGGWNYVVLQEQSQMPVIEHYRYSSTYPSARKLDSIIKSFNCNTMFFMTWGRRYGGIQCINTYCSPDFINFSHMQDSLSSSYNMIANELNDAVCPVGNGFRLSVQTDSSIVLWDADNSHPSLEGSYLAACMFYRKIFNASPVGAQFTAGLSPSTALHLQTIANNTLLSISGSNVTESAFKFSIEKYYPNPFNSSASITFRINKPVEIKLSVYNIQGKFIQKVYKGKIYAGTHNIFWKPEGDLPSGIYYLTAEAENFRVTKRLVYLK